MMPEQVDPWAHYAATAGYKASLTLAQLLFIVTVQL